MIVVVFWCVIATLIVWMIKVTVIDQSRKAAGKITSTRIMRTMKRPVHPMCFPDIEYCGAIIKFTTMIAIMVAIRNVLIFIPFVVSMVVNVILLDVTSVQRWSTGVLH